QAIVNDLGGRRNGAEDQEDGETEEPEDGDQPSSTNLLLVAEVISYAVGCVMGRWNVGFVTGCVEKPELSSPFAPLPLCSPGMLQGNDGLPANDAPKGYPLRIDSDGIIPDDPDHSD